MTSKNGAIFLLLTLFLCSCQKQNNSISQAKKGKIPILIYQKRVSETDAIDSTKYYYDNNHRLIAIKHWGQIGDDSTILLYDNANNLYRQNVYSDNNDLIEYTDFTYPKDSVIETTNTFSSNLFITRIIRDSLNRTIDAYQYVSERMHYSYDLNNNLIKEEVFYPSCIGACNIENLVVGQFEN